MLFFCVYHQNYMSSNSFTHLKVQTRCFVRKNFIVSGMLDFGGIWLVFGLDYQFFEEILTQDD